MLDLNTSGLGHTVLTHQRLGHRSWPKDHRRTPIRDAYLSLPLTEEVPHRTVAGMSVWESESVEEAVVTALGAVHPYNPGGHHFGRPYLTAYQLAIRVDGAHPNIKAALGVQVGGAGTGERTSLAQYLARELSRRIKRAADENTHFPVEGAFISNEHLTELTYKLAGAERLTSSLTGSGFDLSLFRLRP